MGKEIIGHYKYILQDLIAIIYYLHLLLLRSKETATKIYLPFIKYYLAIHPNLIQSTTRKQKPINKFKTAIYVIIAMIRMKNANSEGKGLVRHSNTALKTR